VLVTDIPEVSLMRLWLPHGSASSSSSWHYTAQRWRTNFFPVCIARSILGGSAWEPTPWRAVRRAAWEVLRKDIGV
jgi:hypothetical protein